MIKEVEGFDKYFSLAGFKNVSIDEVATFLKMIRKRAPNTHIQIFDARFIGGWKHLYFAALNALNAFKNNTNISKTLEVECLLYASAQRQINLALKLIGVKKDTSKIAFLVISDNKQAAENSMKIISGIIDGERDDNVYKFTQEKVKHIRELFKISDDELKSLRKDEMDALLNLIIEHGALLVTRR